MGTTSSKDYEFKYWATSDGSWQRLQVAVVGAALAHRLMPEGTRARYGGAGEGGNLKGILIDVCNVYDYFLSNGADVRLLRAGIPALPGDVVKQDVRDFLQGPGNAKVLFFSGHGSRAGSLCLDGGVHISPTEVVSWLNDTRFHGMLTLIIDSCYSGMWSKEFMKALRSGQRTGNIFEEAQQRGRKTYINLRLSCLSWELSADTRMGGKYTQGFLRILRQEHDWTSQVGKGWGTKVWTERGPDGNDLVWSTKKSEPQTDIAVDLVVNTDRTFKWSYPQDRRRYIE